MYYIVIKNHKKNMKKEIVRKLLEYNEFDRGFYHFGLIKLDLKILNRKRKEINRVKDSIYRFVVVDNDSGIHLIVFNLIKREDATKIQTSRKHRVIRRKKEYYSQQHERKYLYGLSRNLKDAESVDLPTMQHINNEIGKYLKVVDVYPRVIEEIASNKTQNIKLYRNFLNIVARNRVLFDRRLRQSLRDETKAKAILIKYSGDITQI